MAAAFLNVKTSLCVCLYGDIAQASSQNIFHCSYFSTCSTCKFSLSLKHAHMMIPYVGHKNTKRNKKNNQNYITQQNAVVDSAAAAAETPLYRDICSQQNQ